jgi:hypothetical protein
MARAAYRQFKENPNHPSLRFKRLRGASDYYSARVGLNYRVLGYRRGDTMIWFWVGKHDEYDKLIK